MALGQAGMVGHLVQRRVEVEQSLDPDLVQILKPQMAVILAQVHRLTNQRVTQMDVQV